MVDLSNLKAGDTVHFRCGGKAVVRRIDQRGDRGAYGKGVFFQNHGGDTFTYNEQGECGQGIGEGPFDIIRVEPAFRWEDVKPGMAFKYEHPNDGETRDAFFVCVNVHGEACFSIEGYACPQTLGPINARNLRPNHEHDIEVVK